MYRAESRAVNSSVTEWSDFRETVARVLGGVCDTLSPGADEETIDNRAILWRALTPGMWKELSLPRQWVTEVVRDAVRLVVSTRPGVRGAATRVFRCRYQPGDAWPGDGTVVNVNLGMNADDREGEDGWLLWVIGVEYPDTRVAKVETEAPAPSEPLAITA